MTEQTEALAIPSDPAKPETKTNIWGRVHAGVGKWHWFGEEGRAICSCLTTLTNRVEKMGETTVKLPEGTDFYRDMCSSCKDKRRIKAFGGGFEGWKRNKNRFRETGR